MGLHVRPFPFCFYIASHHAHCTVFRRRAAHLILHGKASFFFVPCRGSPPIAGIICNVSSSFTFSVSDACPPVLFVCSFFSVSPLLTAL